MRRWMPRKERTLVVKLAPVVALNCLHDSTELGGDVSDEVADRAESAKFNA